MLFMCSSRYTPSYGCLSSSRKSVQPENTRSRTVSIIEPLGDVLEKLVSRALKARWRCALCVMECFDYRAEALEKICSETI
jgi:hypothetical protein